LNVQLLRWSSLRLGYYFVWA